MYFVALTSFSRGVLMQRTRPLLLPSNCSGGPCSTSAMELATSRRNAEGYSIRYVCGSNRSTPNTNFYRRADAERQIRNTPRRAQQTNSSHSVLFYNFNRHELLSTQQQIFQAPKRKCICLPRPKSYAPRALTASPQVIVWWIRFVPNEIWKRRTIIVTSSMSCT